MDWETSDLLVTAITIGGWCVSSTNIIEGAELMRRGYMDACDSAYEGPRFFATDKGIAFALRKGWIRAYTAKERAADYYLGQFERLLPHKKPKEAASP